jgi:hypothetical protein
VARGLIQGALQGLGEAMQTFGTDALRMELLSQRDARLAELQAQRDDKQHVRQVERDEGARKHDRDMVDVQTEAAGKRTQQAINIETNPDNIALRAGASNALSEQTRPTRLQEARDVAKVNLDAEVAAFEKLAPLKRQEAIAAAVETVKAQATPEMLRATRSIAQAKHIVDPSYTAMVQDDGSVAMINTKNPRDVVAVKNTDGTPITRRDPEELKAATAVLNMVNTNLKIAQAEHKASIADIGASPADKAAANAAWERAQQEAKEQRAPALAVIMGKAKAGPVSEAPKPAGPPPSKVEIDGLMARKDNPQAVQFFNNRFGAGAAERILGGANGGTAKLPDTQFKADAGGPNALSAQRFLDKYRGSIDAMTGDQLSRYRDIEERSKQPRGLGAVLDRQRPKPARVVDDNYDEMPAP